MSNLWDNEEEFQDKPEDAISVQQSKSVQELAQQLIPPLATAPLPAANRPEPKSRGFTPLTAPAEPEVAVFEGDPELDLFPDGDDEEEDFSAVLNDASLRLEQGNLYKMIMNHSLFEGMEADARAIKNVEREIKRFARERMEVMLGMRQEAPKHAVVASPFNDLEVDILKKLASKATNGATETAEANQVASVLRAPKRTTLNPIGGTTAPKSASKPQLHSKTSAAKLPTKAATPMKRTQLDLTIEQVAAEAGVSVDELKKELGYVPLEKPINALSAEEQAKRLKETQERIRSTTKRVTSTSALPPATPEQEAALAIQRATQIQGAPGMAALLAKVSTMPAKNPG